MKVPEKYARVLEDLNVSQGAIEEKMKLRQENEEAVTNRAKNLLAMVTEATTLPAPGKECPLQHINLRDEAVLDHESTARARGLITTASYSQVTEPIYKRASGRWQRYREHLAPILPTLAPWAEKFGYTM